MLTQVLVKIDNGFFKVAKRKVAIGTTTQRFLNSTGGFAVFILA